MNLSSGDSRTHAPGGFECRWTAAQCLRQLVQGLCVPRFLHQVNNALTGSLCHIQLAVSEAEGQKAFLEQAQSSLESLGKGCSHLQDFMDLPIDRCEVFSLRDWLTRLPEWVGFLPGFRRIPCVLEAPAEECQVRANAGLLTCWILLTLAFSQTPASESEKMAMTFTWQPAPSGRVLLVLQAKGLQLCSLLAGESPLTALLEQIPGEARGFTLHGSATTLSFGMQQEKTP